MTTTLTCARVMATVATVWLLAAACQKGQEPAPTTTPSPTPPPPPAPPTPAAGAIGAATLTGTVKLTGTPPEMPLTKRQGDPFCARTPVKEEEVIVGAGGGLKNVVVRITKGVTGRYDAPAASATLDQSACMYRPRVQAVVAGQTLIIKNSDQTLHNVHGYKGPTTLFNQAEIPGLPPISRKMVDADQILKFKCDVHPWMTGYVAISSHPFFAVTGDDGAFKIAGVPPGKYTLEAWHERYGTKTTDITVADGKPSELAFTYESR